MNIYIIHRIKLLLILSLSFGAISCSSDDDEPIKQITVKLKFTHDWDNELVTQEEYNQFLFENKLSVKMSISKLRYLISRINLINSANDTIKFEGYKLADVSNSDSLIHELPQTVSEGLYQLSFTFGFTDEDNVSEIYTDLNTANWSVPDTLGGGYHFMQLEGQYKDSIGTAHPYLFHTISAFNTSTSEKKDTSFSVNIGTIQLKNNATVEIKMDVAEWFKTPHTWDIKTLNTDLMSNFEAQEMMSDNGKNVFSLGSVEQ